jgi:hypothetical protein
MRTDDPNEVIIERLAGITRLRLPRRDLSAHRKLGWTGIGFGTVLCLFMILWISGPLSMGIDQLLKGELFGIGMVLFACSGLIGLGIAFMILAAAIGVLTNRTFSQIEIRGQRLNSREYFGPISLRLVNLKFSQIKQLEISPMPQEWFGKGENSFKIDVEVDWYVLRAEATVPTRRPPLLAVAYPSELLQQVAETIKTEVSRNSSSALKGTWLDAAATDFNQSLVAGADKRGARGAVTAEHELPIVIVSDQSQQTPVRPAECQVEIVRIDGQPTVFRLPAMGFRGHVLGLMSFACIWNIFVFGFFGIFIGIAIKDGKFGDLLPVSIFAALFLGAGLFVLYSAINAAKRSAMIGIDADMLFCETKELFRKTWSEIPRDQLQSIEVAPSGTSLNDVPVMQIQITQIAPAGKITRLFTGLPVDELDWIRHELLQELQRLKQKSL